MDGGGGLRVRVNHKMKRSRGQKGAAIVEYGALMAFVCVLIAIAFMFNKNSLGTAILNSYSTITSDLNAMAATASNGGAPSSNDGGSGGSGP
jgi:Flp pilus assembly pilin Flp